MGGDCLSEVEREGEVGESRFLGDRLVRVRGLAGALETGSEGFGETVGDVARAIRLTDIA